MCYESCRLFYPAEMAGDYVRGQSYENGKLVEVYPQFFRGKPEIKAIPYNPHNNDIPMPDITEINVDSPPSSVVEGVNKKNAKD